MSDERDFDGRPRRGELAKASYGLPADRVRGATEQFASGESRRAAVDPAPLAASSIKRSRASCMLVCWTR